MRTLEYKMYLLKQYYENKHLLLDQSVMFEKDKSMNHAVID